MADPLPQLTPQTRERVFRTLGEGVARIWSGLPQAIQQELFEAAVRSEGEGMRQPIAIFLHDQHDRTKSALQSHAQTEPDSKGG
jgi:hypothetical protein